MNWEALSFDWNQARGFLATALEGSLSSAARHLGQTQPTLSRQVAALEAQLGVTLFERVGKRLVLTETGADLLEHVRAMGEAAGMVSLSASGRSQAVYGRVRVSAAGIVAAYLLPPIVESIREQYPQIELELVVSSRLSDLRQREADIAIRHVRPEQPDLFARKARQCLGHLYAADSWIVRHGRPGSAEDIAGAVFVGEADPSRFIEAMRSVGLPLSSGQFKLLTESGIVGWELVKQGVALGVMLEDVARVTPAVQRLLPELPGIPVPYWVCAHRELQTSRRIRVVFDLLADALCALPDVEGPVAAPQATVATSSDQ